MADNAMAYKEPTINFVDANDVKNDTIRMFRDHADRIFLIGFVKRGKLDWILNHKKYNVRVDDAERRGSVDLRNPMSFAVNYIILYESRFSNRFRVFKAESYKLYKKEEMGSIEYDDPHCDYLVYDLGDEVHFEKLALKHLIATENPENPFLPIYLTGHTIFSCYRRLRTKRIGLVDADLLCNGTRHPNLALLKIAGYLFDNDVPYDLILDPNADISQYSHIYMSRVFSFTKEPAFYENASESEKKKFHTGGTGYYATITSVSEFRKKREEDMERLSHDKYLNTLTCKHSGRHGINMATQMPDYHLYDKFVLQQIKLGFKRDKYKDYLDYSIGFLTRKCFRHCPFCVNKLEDSVVPYSELEWFHDKTRPHVYFWDDNFLAAPYEIWKPRLQYLIDHKISFQFRQGLDERMLAQSPHGEEMAEMLSRSRYHGDFIYAFDNWRDKELIEKALKIWKKHNPKKGTKFYLFCGFMQTKDNQKKFYRDIWEIFQRIKVLMSYGCVGYVMRHEDYHNAPISNLYIQIARWCNQQQFYKKMSFWEFCYRNQSYWEEKTLKVTDRPQLKTYEEFMQDMEAGYYGDEKGKVKLCLPLKSLLETLDMFPDKKKELMDMFNYKMANLINPHLWED